LHDVVVAVAGGGRVASTGGGSGRSTALTVLRPERREYRVAAPAEVPVA